MCVSHLVRYRKFENQNQMWRFLSSSKHRTESDYADKMGHPADYFHKNMQVILSWIKEKQLILYLVMTPKAWFSL